jgi:hypothetical protein
VFDERPDEDTDRAPLGRGLDLTEGVGSDGTETQRRQQQRLLPQNRGEQRGVVRRDVVHRHRERADEQ